MSLFIKRTMFIQKNLDIFSENSNVMIIAIFALFLIIKLSLIFQFCNLFTNFQHIFRNALLIFTCLNIMAELIEQSLKTSQHTSSKIQSSIQNALANLIRKLKADTNLICRKFFRNNHLQRVVISCSKPIIYNFQMLTIISIDIRNFIICVKSFISENILITMYDSLEQKKLAMKYLFTRLMNNSWFWEPNISINISNGVFSISSTQYVSENVYTCYPTIQGIVKNHYNIQIAALQAHLPKTMSFSKSIPQKYKNKQVQLKKLPYCKLQDEQIYMNIVKYYRMCSTKAKFTMNSLASVQISKNQPTTVVKKLDRSLEMFSFYINLEKQMKLSEQQTRIIFMKIQERPSFQAQNENENKYIHNYIEVVQKQTPIYLNKGGFSQIFVSLTKFCYKKTVQVLQEQLLTKKKKRLAFRKEKRQIVLIEKWLAFKQPISNQHSYIIQHQKEILKKLRLLSSAYLLKYYSSINFQKFLFMDPSNAPNLAQYLYLSSQTVSIITKLIFLIHVSKGLTFLKKNEICHMDLKPQNILAEVNLLNIRLLDFGSAYQKNVCKTFYKPGHTLPYAPPQLLRVERTSFSQKSDVFSFGIVLYYVLFSKIPFTSISKLKQHYITGDYLRFIQQVPQQLNSYGDDRLIRLLFGLIMKCLNPIEDQRPQLQWISLILGDILVYMLKIC